MPHEPLGDFFGVFDFLPEVLLVAAGDGWRLG